MKTNKKDILTLIQALKKLDLVGNQPMINRLKLKYAL